MGTNYYHHRETHPACEHCGRGPDEEVLHIGKSSLGWTFSLHVIPEMGLTSWDAWLARLQAGGRILDEYDREIELSAFVAVVTERIGPACLLDWARPIEAVPGPNNCIRHRVDGAYCVGHGEGTWDYVAGEFC